MGNIKILITGSDGFIGKNVVRYLRKKGYLIRTADIKSGKDLRDFKVCMKSTKGVDWIVHLAADIGGSFYLKDNKQVAKNNTLIDLNMILASKLNKVKHFFFSSSSCIYDPESYYGASKKLTEEILRISNLNYSIARLQNVFGEYETIGGIKEKVIPSFIRQINKGKVKVYGDGSQIRSFIYVKDVCEIIENMIKNKIKIKEVGGDIISIKELLILLINISKKKVKVKYGKTIKDRTNKFLHSMAKTDLIKALRKTYKWTTKKINQ